MIEVLAVIVVLSLIAGTAIVQLAAVNDGMLIESIASQMRDLDAKARLHARTGEPCEFLLDDESQSLILQRTGMADALKRVDWPQHLHVAIQTDAESHPTIAFNRLGRSIDYTVALSTDVSVRTWRISGLTGHFTVQETAP